MDEEIYNRPKVAMDYLPENPGKALEMIWYDEEIDTFIHQQLTPWFYMAMTSLGSIYNNEDPIIRMYFIKFYSDLLPFVEATFCYNIRSQFYLKNHQYPDIRALRAILRKMICSDYSFIYLTDEAMVNPLPIIQNFCDEYELQYVRRELWDFLDAVHHYSGPFVDIISGHFFPHYYRKLMTIVEISYVLTKGVKTRPL